MTVAIARVNKPDALLVLLLVVSAWLTLRAVESGRTKHLAWAGVVVGLAFMTKMLQGWMVVPALAAAYLLAGPPRLAVRRAAAARGRRGDGRGQRRVAARGLAVARLDAVHRRQRRTARCGT